MDHSDCTRLVKSSKQKEESVSYAEQPKININNSRHAWLIGPIISKRRDTIQGIKNEIIKLILAEIDKDPFIDNISISANDETKVKYILLLNKESIPHSVNKEGDIILDISQLK